MTFYLRVAEIKGMKISESQEIYSCESTEAVRANLVMIVNQ